MSDICPRCEKRVYFAERRLYKGKYYHQICSNKQQDEDLAPKKYFAIHEEMNCNPAERKPVNAAQSLGIPRSSIPSKAKTCSSCSFQLNDDCRFCPNCGKQVEEPKEEKIEVKPDPKVFCTGCGSRYPDDGNFCSSCGNKRP